MQRVSLILQASGMAMGLLVFALGLSAGLAALGDAGKPVNVIWALLALISLPTLSLLLWMISCVLPQAKGGWLGQAWAWLTNCLLPGQSCPGLAGLVKRGRRKTSHEMVAGRGHPQPLGHYAGRSLVCLVSGF